VCDQGVDRQARPAGAMIIRQLPQELLHELDDSVAGVGTAGTQPPLQYLFGLGAQCQQWMVGGDAALMRIVALRCVPRVRDLGIR